MQVRRGTRNRNTVNLLLDGAVFITFLMTTAPRFTGMAIHEWLGLALGAALVTHLLLHWSWIVQVTRRFFGKVTWQARVNYLWNSLLFISFTTIIVTGLLISEVALPVFGINSERDRLWMNLHRLASDATVLIVGVHVALHWRWIISATRRLFSREGQRAAPQIEPAAQATVVAQEAQR